MFDSIKQTLTIRQVVEHYQGKALKNKVPCPFHQDKTPSLHIYDKTQTYQCFVCRTGGDLINFTSRLHNCNNLEACKILNESFNLGIVAGKVNKKSIIEAEKQRRAKKEAELLQKNKELELISEFNKWYLTSEYLKPRRGQAPSEAYAIAINELQKIEYKLNRA